MPVVRYRTPLLRRSAAAAVLCFLLGAVVVSPAAAQKADAEVAELRKRVEQLEGQLVDLQVVIGTLESLARSPRGGQSAQRAYGQPSNIDPSRLSALETQVKALASQIERMSGRAAPQGYTPQRGAARQPVPRGSITSGSFGQTTVTPSDGDPIGGLLQRDTGEPSGSSRQSNAAFSEGGPDDQYEAAYGALLQQNYSVAATGFQQFLKDHPRHQLAGNAQYWLGEVYYVRRNYNAAAKAFLKGYRTYAQSPKAPDSLLKLAMSLDRLGARDDACASFAAINERFPQAPGHVRNRASSEIRRLRC
ncbi:MAG: tol-pal system protein YbgF [Pseudomonadota bacterium]